MERYAPPFSMSWVGLIILLVTTVAVSSAANCHRSNCQLKVADECRDSMEVYCNLRKQSNKKINITKTSFPKHVQKITIRYVEEMEIQADAIASLASLESIELENINTLNMLPRSLAHTNENGLNITIRGVNKCHMSQMTVPPSTLIRSLHLVHINDLTIHQDAFATNSTVDYLWLTEVTSLTVKTSAFAPKTSIRTMELEDIKSMTLHTGAFARNSSIQKAVVARVKSLLIGTDGIQASISKLTISDVTMTNCENNTFGSTIQAMSLASSQIKIAKYGCISASSGWEELLVEKCRFDCIESLAIRGTIKQVLIKDNYIGTVKRKGFSLNVTRFTVERTEMGKLSEKALAVYAAEVITLKNCEVTNLGKHAFSLLQLNSRAEKPIRIENLDIDEAENESMQFASGSNVEVFQLKLDIPCTCDMVLQLGLPSRPHQSHGNDTKTYRWIDQIYCVSNTTTTILAEYKNESCPDPTVTSSSSSSRSGGGMLQGGCSLSPNYTTSQDKSSVPGLTCIGSVKTWFVIGTIIVAFLL